jgi:hypothetical protein
MTLLVLGCTVIALGAVMVIYLLIALVVMAVRSCVVCSSLRRVSPLPPQAEEPARWTALDDQQVARYLKQAPP